MRPALTLACLALAYMLSGCQVLFHADFEADTVGSRPNPSPAGPPAGDWINVWIADPGNAVVVSDPLFGNRLIQSYQESLTQIDFNGIETSRTVQQYVAMWNGCADRFSDETPRFHFSIGNAHTGRANFQIQNGQFMADGEVLGRVVIGEVHTVSVRVDNEAGTYTVTVAQPASGPADGACANAGRSRPACPDGFRFERGACRSGPNFWGHRSHCPLEGRTGCAICRDDEVVDTMNGTCRSRSGVRDRMTSSTRTMGPGSGPRMPRVGIAMSYSNIVPSDPGSYIIDDVWIYRPEE